MRLFWTVRIAGRSSIAAIGVFDDSFCPGTQTQGSRKKNKGDASTLTGCLSKDASGNYVLADEAHGCKK